jgi:predicted NAD/FAD-dependent oxidoreductase
MIAFESPLVQLPYDGVSFDDAPTEFGSLGWIARDTSKPGRERSDGGECWIVQSGSEAAKKVLEMTKDEPDFEKRRELVREKAKELLLNDFVRAIQKLSGDDNAAIPPIVSAVGHRWSAAFPLQQSRSSQGMDCIADIDNRFIACGDYVGKLPGRVEGAYVSGSAAAAALLDACSV